MNNTELETLNYIKDNWKTMTPTIPIVIPSYKNRKGCIVQELNKLSDNDIMYSCMKMIILNQVMISMTISQMFIL